MSSRMGWANAIIASLSILHQLTHRFLGCVPPEVRVWRQIHRWRASGFLYSVIDYEVAAVYAACLSRACAVAPS